MNIVKTTLVVTAFGGLSACSVEGLALEGTNRFQGADDYIAVAADSGQRRGGRNINDNASDNAGIAVTPDGCQAWIIDDGIEGRASNRLDPISGLPVCGGEPGVVYGDYQSGASEIRDRVPRRIPETEVVNIEIINPAGHGHVVHDGT